MIATPHTAASRAGAESFRQGGNAIDAALAAAATLCAAYPHNTSLGGDAVCLVRTPDGRTVAINATGPAPARVDVSSLRDRYGLRLPHRGIDTVTVPGGAMSWKAIHKLGGRRPWARIFDTAIELASDGVPVARSVARNIRALGDLLIPGSPLAELFAPRGEPLADGDIFHQPALAASLRTIAVEGTEALYGGSVGQALVTGLRRLGSPVQLDDLTSYAPEVIAPIFRRFRGSTVFTTPPNSPGFALLRMLDALDRHDLDPIAALTTQVGLVADEFLNGNRICESMLADPRWMSASVESLVDSAALTDPQHTERTGPLRASGDTIGIAAMDDDGFGVAIVQSIFSGFGSTVLEPETGILMHNRGSLFSLEGDSPNVIDGGKRPRHTLMPVMTDNADGKLGWVTATMGGPNQPQIQAQVLLRILAGVPVDEAVNAPRWLVGARVEGDTDRTIYLESDLDEDIRRQLGAAGYTESVLPSCDEGAGHMNAVGRTSSGELVGSSDARADGESLLVQLPPD